MLASGATVALWDSDGEKLAEAKGTLGQAGRVSTHVVELTSETDVAAAAEGVAQAHRKIDILVNNAGITGGNATTWELAPDVWRRVIDVNLVAPYLVCRAVVPKMIANKYGRIVNIASVAGKEGNPNASHYSASKAGLIALTKSLGKELAGKGVLVNAVSPAAAKTAMFATMTQAHIDFMLSKIPMGRFLEVNEAAAMVAWLASEECSFTHRLGVRPVGRAGDVLTIRRAADLLVLQQPPHHLARARLRQRVDELDDLRHLVGGHVLLGPGDDVLGLGVLGRGAQHHHRLDGLAAIGVLGGDDAGLLHRRMLVEQHLHLGRPDLEAAGVDHPLQPVGHEEVAFLVHPAEVAGAEERAPLELDEGLGGRLRDASSSP